MPLFRSRDDAAAAARSPIIDIEREEQRRCLRREFDVLFEKCGAGVMIVRETGVIERVNGTVRRIFGSSTNDLAGMTLLSVTLNEEIDNLFRTARDTSTPREREIKQLGGSGGCLAVSVTPVDDGGHAQRLYLVVARDVTELRRLETVRRDFVANVSHELRTPLASIRALAETLQDGAVEDADVAGRFLTSIINETQRLTRIAEDLLVLGDAESRVSEKSVFDLSSLIAEIVLRFQPQAENANVDLDSSVPLDLRITGNRDQIEQVVVNLVDNALKYTPPGGKAIVSANREPDCVAVRVSDTGIGIMSQDLPRIFERFYRVDKARSRQSGGTGLGLSIVKHIVESHGGTVTVESEFNRGATFTFKLPD